MIGVKIKEMNGNIFDFPCRSLMLFANKITITIIVKTLTAKISVISDS